MSGSTLSLDGRVIAVLRASRRDVPISDGGDTQERDSDSCPVCFELPSGEVFQCRNGHLLCAECLQQHRNTARRNTCPTCRVSMVRVSSTSPSR